MKSLDPTHSPFDSNSSVERLESPDSDHLRAAQAWLELGNYAVSDACLDQIKAAVQSHPDVLELRWHLSACTQRWASCLGIANAVIRVDSERASGWINRSVALHNFGTPKKPTTISCRQRAALPTTRSFPTI